MTEQRLGEMYDSARARSRRVRRGKRDESADDMLEVLDVLRAAYGLTCRPCSNIPGGPIQRAHWDTVEAGLLRNALEGGAIGLVSHWGLCGACDHTPSLHGPDGCVKCDCIISEAMVKARIQGCVGRVDVRSDASGTFRSIKKQSQRFELEKSA